MITFSRYKLSDFLACQRRFQLRYIQNLPWPTPPQPSDQAEALTHGEQFHRLLERHFLGLSVDAAALPNPLRSWWHTWQTDPPAIPPGHTLPEFRLTVPISQHLLLGRFDLLILGDHSAHIYDWKTERRPRTASALRADLQSRLYLALVAEGIRAIHPQKTPIPPEQVQLTYWFVEAPAATVTLTYSTAEHAQNWSDLSQIVGQIEAQMTTTTPWPLTTDLQECGRCVYQLFCTRPRPTLQLDEHWYQETPEHPETNLEPALP
ncbi:MAG: PD-(D/E)XK nuclease family protein [Chloroflexi bacterium]|nr:PD-(D/E)XK nuclease family protein [Chloroflexota bacterium]MBP8055429.1 PD-(D/E)XK nuclease family protein [Chloroflexota bacterium]